MMSETLSLSKHTLQKTHATQVLTSLHEQYDTISIEDVVTRNFAILLALSVYLKLIFGAILFRTSRIEPGLPSSTLAPALSRTTSTAVACERGSEDAESKMPAKDRDAAKHVHTQVVIRDVSLQLMPEKDAGAEQGKFLLRHVSACVESGEVSLGRHRSDSATCLDCSCYLLPCHPPSRVPLLTSHPLRRARRCSQSWGHRVRERRHFSRS